MNPLSGYSTILQCLVSVLLKLLVNMFQRKTMVTGLYFRAQM